jgi:hypothetical protein
MPAMQVPNPLPPTITLPREAIELAVSQHLEEFGESSLVANTWRWVLHGGGPGPISHMDWSEFDGKGPPSKLTLAAESTANQPTLLAYASWAELNKARFICWWCAANREAEIPIRFRPWDSTPDPAVMEEGSVTPGEAVSAANACPSRASRSRSLCNAGPGRASSCRTGG